VRRGSTVDRCYICSKVRPCEREHVWPKRLNGTATAPICVSCHDALDRMNIDALEIDEAAAGWANLAKRLGEKWCTALCALEPEIRKGPGAGVITREHVEPMFTLLCRGWWKLKPEGRLIGMKICRIMADSAKWTDEPQVVQHITQLARILAA
jgi:hypothetical protein